MNYDVKTVEEYLNAIPKDRRPFVEKLRDIIKENLPEGFKEEISYGMIGFVVPHDIYPNGYHVNPELPLPFINIASQKNFIALYHSGIYTSPELMEWFKKEYSERITTKLDMGKSCIRFKNLKNIPFDLIEELAKKISVDDWILQYENSLSKMKNK
ncbi:DUF1801 domain-containing protein [Marivirga arenosa]|uniref:DUF1801 domain-containing protein n=1 Tax=Marivirga arenosa TaxID=3059076 RepID=A0AA51N7W8_9BACT|nr:DUF1801 domain-containing protein [Marivirga sp. ABR2-2]WMN07589.1 DUF1801 domain-containing protein [Marivirga sp. ABR2-2]